MELIEGQPLDRMISENGLPVEPSPSTSWMDSLPPIGASRLRTSATGSEVALWRNGLRGSIRIIPDGIGSPCSSMRTVSATTKALDVVLKVNMPAFWRPHFALATAYAQLGERDAESNAVREFLTMRPDFPVVCAQRTPEMVGCRTHPALDRRSSQGRIGNRGRSWSASCQACSHVILRRRSPSGTVPGGWSTNHKLTHYRTVLFGAHRKFTGL
jgi:hypothetical protein